MTDECTIIGIDPGTIVCGYGVIQVGGQDARVLDYGVVKQRKGELPERLVAIHKGLKVIFERFEPDVAAVEGAFYGKNARTALKIGEARGMVLTTAGANGCEIVEYAPATVKKSVVGNGRAKKYQVQEMVRAILGLNDLPEPEDASDALAVAVCHWHRMQRPQLR
jgi:crossover junction endodeoxyribonuclease RuvC